MEKLIPPDLKRCQCMKRSGGFFSFGPPGEWRQCDKAPRWIATEKKAPPGKGKRRGSMALCDGCRKILEMKQPGYATFKKIERRALKATEEATP